jgi:hypothetical protein
MILSSTDIQIGKALKRGRKAMKILSVAEIMAADDITTEEVPIPAWGGAVVVRSISHRTMRKIKQKLDAEFDGDAPEGEYEKRIWMEGVIEPKFSDEEYEHVLDKSSRNVMKVLNAILKESRATETAVKEEEKKFPDESAGVLPVPTSGENADNGAGTSDRDQAAS